jgi:hypothetical protein
MEHMLAQGMPGLTKREVYEDLRDHVALSTAIACMWQMTSIANEVLGCGLGGQLKAIWERCAAFEHWVPLPKGRT